MPGSKAQVDDQTMYDTWVAFGRNASKASKSLGIHAHTMQHHVRTKDFEKKFLLEYGGLAEGSMRAGIVRAMLAIPEMIDTLVEIARTSHIVTDENGVDVVNPQIMQARVKAIATMRDWLPDNLSTAVNADIVDASAWLVQTGGDMSPEEEVRLQLEANIVDASEARTRTRSN